MTNEEIWEKINELLDEAEALAEEIHNEQKQCIQHVS